MRTLAVILGITSGFALAGYYEPPARMIATSLIIDASLAPLTAIVASRRGRSPALWTVFGFSLGMWALAFVLIFRPHASGSDQPVQPPTSDAA
jgi:hypothetical protein